MAKKSKVAQRRQSRSASKEKTPTDLSQLQIPKGLPNLGNTCFFNSVTQCILQTQALNYYLNEVVKIKELVIPKDCIVSINDVKVEVSAAQIPLPEPEMLFVKTFSNLLAEFRCGRSPNPQNLFNQIARKVPRFRGWAQQDAHELLRYLLDVLRSDEIDRFKEGIEDYLDNKEANSDLLRKAILKCAAIPLLDSVFGGTLLQTIRCSECNYVSTTFELFLDLSLPLVRDDCNKKNNVVQAKSKYQLKKEQRNIKKKANKKRKKRGSEMELGSEENKEGSSKQEDDEKPNESYEEILENGNEVDEINGNVEIDLIGEFEKLAVDSNADCISALLEENGNDDNSNGIMMALRRYFSEDVLAAADAYECEKCCAPLNRKEKKDEPRKTVVSHKRYFVFSPPPILTLHMKRFEQTHTFSRTTSSKIRGHIEFPMVLDLASFCSKSEEVNVHSDISDCWECVKTAGLINCHLIKCNIRKMGLTSHLMDFSIILVLCVLFFQCENWFTITLICLLFRYFSSDTGKRGLKTLPRDLKGLVLLFRVKWTMHQGFKRNKPLHYYFLDHVKQHPNKECVVEVETGRKFTFSQLNALANKYANAYKKVSNEKQIAIFLENSADFFACWLGLSKVGVITAWINSNLKAEPLAHSIKVAKTEIVLTSTSLLPTLLKTIDTGLLPQNLIIYTIDKPENNGRSKSIQDFLHDTTEPEPNNDVNFQSVLCYIYTSGTTGNPKPAVIKHFRYFFIAMGSGKSFGVTPDERIYITMPMYHSAAGILGIGQVVVLGATAIIRKKFSARNFWTEARDHQCTASQYIGEICRYLLAQPKSKVEREHSVRLMYGNGLRPEIWKEFVERFGIRKVGELYGSTEGNSNIVNINNHVGSCGFFPIYPFLTALYPVRLVKVNPETGELLRGENGLCISCRPGDTGEMVGMIKKNDPLLRFEGYVNKDDTDKKVITDVTRKGDVVFSSGDILYWDQYGYLYFKDRRGDTYRWRGENVSTMEVEGVLQPLMQIQNATVFGVEVNGREGRAGMIGATLNSNVDIEEFVDVTAKRLCDNLAAYAIPVFLRICKEVETTGTFKLKKSALQKDGFNPAKCGEDPLFYFDYTAKAYKSLDSDMYNMIQSGKYSKI